MKALLQSLAVVAAVLLTTGAEAQPAFRGASTAITPGSPTFRAAASAAFQDTPVFRASSSAATTTGSLSLPVPTGTAVDDVMIAAIGVRPSTATLTEPAGWTLVRRTNNATNPSSSLAVYRKVAVAGEPASYEWTVGGATGTAGGIQSFVHVDTANPINVENGTTTASSLSHATPSITTTVPRGMIVTAHSIPSGTTWTPPAGMNEGFDRATTSDVHSIEANYVIQSAAGATGTKTAIAASGADPGVTHILALRPSPAVLTISRPAGTVANDVMIAAVSARPSAATISMPAGWTLVRRTDNTTAPSSSLAVFRKTAGASEPASYSWALTGATGAAGGIHAFSNVDAVNPVDVDAGQATPTSLSHSTPSVSTTIGNAMVVTAHSLTSTTTWTPPSGMTESVDRGTPLDVQSIEMSYVLQTTAGATGTKTATAASGADPGVTHIMALRPVPKILTISRPAGALAGDVLIAAVGFRPSTAAIGAPAGWTLVRRVDNTASPTSSIAIFRRVVVPSEPASYAWDATGTMAAAGGIQAFANVDVTNPINAESGQATPTSLSHSTPTITSTVANAMIVTAHGLPSATTWTPPSGMTEAFDLSVGGQHSIESSYALQPAAGATGAKTATAASGADPGNAHILALRPAGPAVAQLYFIHVDHLNTPRLVANAQGQAVWRWDQQEPFGNNVADENPSGLGAFDLPLRLRGQYFDKETNLHYNYFRDYDSSIGRFAQSDPIGVDGGLNTYAYAESDPLFWIDELGLASGKQNDPPPARSILPAPAPRSIPTITGAPILQPKFLPIVPPGFFRPAPPPTVGGGACDPCKNPNFSGGKAVQIQNAATARATPVVVVGSRTSSILQPYSDWDYIIPANATTRGRIKSSLPRGPLGTGGNGYGSEIWQCTDPTMLRTFNPLDPTRPYIIFWPD